jgi:hypothetical protein
MSIWSSGRAIKRALATAKAMKEDSPKIYAAAKKAVQMSSMAKLSGVNDIRSGTMRRYMRIVPAEGIAVSKIIKPERDYMRKMGMSVKEVDAKPNADALQKYASKIMRRLRALEARGILPAAAAGAGIAASRSKGKQGYAYGGVATRKEGPIMPPRNPSMRTRIGNAVKGAAKGVGNAYDKVDEAYWNAVLTRGAAASRFNPIRPLKYVAKMVGRNPAWRGVMGVASPVADVALGTQAYGALAKDYAKKAKEGRVNPDKLKGFAYGGMVSKNRLYRGVKRKAK